MNIKDVAKRAGVSISTVSNALNGKKKVSEAKREAVLRAAQDLGYVPNINARLMKARVTGNIGLFLPYIDGPFYSALIQAVYHACARAGYAMFAHVAEGYDSRRTAATMLSCNIDAAVVLNDHLQDAEITQINERGLPIVFLDRRVRLRGTSSIVLDNEKGVTQEVEYLKHTGHERVAYLMGFANYDGMTRARAFRQAMEKFSLPVDENLIMQGAFKAEMAYNCVHSLFSRSVDLPDAILCANDDMAIGSLRALADLGLNVPRDVSVLGFDDIGPAAAAFPALTTVQYSMPMYANMALDELMRLMRDDAPEGQILTLDTRLVVRDSVAIRYSGRL